MSLAVAQGHGDLKSSVSGYRSDCGRTEHESPKRFRPTGDGGAVPVPGEHLVVDRADDGFELAVSIEIGKSGRGVDGSACAHGKSWDDHSAERQSVEETIGRAHDNVGLSVAIEVADCRRASWLAPEMDRPPGKGRAVTSEDVEHGIERSDDDL